MQEIGIEEPYGFIYITTNLINNKKYIGQKIYKYDWKYYLGSGIALNSAIKKYGRKNFERKIIENCYSSEELDIREKYWINYFDAINNINFYNIAAGGDGGNTLAGYSKSDIKKVREKQRESLNGKNSKLDEKEVQDIKTSILNGVTEDDLAQKYKVKPSTIGKIKTCKNWSWVNSELNEKLINMTRNNSESINNKIIDYYYKNNKMSAKQISDALKLPYGRVLKLLSPLIDERNITKHNTVIQLWNDGIKDTKIIAVKCNMHQGTVNRYLKDAHVKGLCEYDINKIINERRKNAVEASKKKCCKSVICIEKNNIFKSAREANYETGVSYKCISLCCLGKQYTAGGLHWMFYEDYLKLHKERDLKEVI